MPVSPSANQSLKTLYNALDDRVLEPGDPVYVEQVNAAGPHDAVAEIATEIEWQDLGGVCLFTGQRGTGKSTELKRLQDRLNRDDAVAFYVDLSEYILLTKPIEISDFLVSVVGALSEELSKRYDGKSPGNRGYWERFKTFLTKTEVEFTEIGGEDGVSIKAALKRDPVFKERVQKAARGHVAQIVRDAHDFVREAVEFVREQEHDPKTKVVLIVDSVERIRGVGPEAMAVFDSVRNLFFSHAESLRIPLIHLVYTVPPYLSVLAAGAGALMGGATTRRLVSTHVFRDRSRDPDPRGLDVLVKIIRARYPEWEKVLTRQALERLGMSSGGDLREFFHLIRLCLPAVRDDSELPLSANAVAHAENAVRNEMLPIPRDHLTWLQQISQTHETCLASDAQLPVLAHFLDSRLVLNYRNGSDWYDVHPLLREHIDAWKPTV